MTVNLYILYTVALYRYAYPVKTFNFNSKCNSIYTLVNIYCNCKYLINSQIYDSYPGTSMETP